MGRAVAGQTKTIGVELGSVANAGKFQVAPTLDAADFRISINGGAFAALTNTPTVTPSGGAQVVIVVAAAETTAAGAGGRAHIRCSDSSGNEWQDLAIDIEVFATPEETGVTLADNAITAAKIASDAITAAKIADGAIDAATFAAGAINAAAIATDAIDADALKADAVTEIQTGLATAASIAALNNLSAAQVNTEVDTALADYDAPTKAELDTAVSTLATASALATVAGYIDTEIASIIAAIAALNDISAADVNAQMLDVLVTDTFAESSAVPAATASLKDKINWLATLARNKITQSATTQTLRNDADSASIATSTVSDSGTVFTRGEWS